MDTLKVKFPPNILVYQSLLWPNLKHGFLQQRIIIVKKEWPAVYGSWTYKW